MKPVNIANRLRLHANGNPDQAAVIIRRTRQAMTFRELDRDSDAAARGMTSAGLRRGDRAIVMVRPGLTFFSLIFALFKAGAVPVLIDPGMGLGRLLECAGSVEPEAFIGIPAAQITRLIYSARFKSVKLAVTAGRRWFWGGKTWNSVKSFSDAPFPIADTQPSDPAAILFTTGSTGPAKGVNYEHGMFDRQVELLTNAFSIKPGDKDCATFPGFSLFSVAMGMTAVVPDMDPTRPAKADPREIAGAIADHGCTFSFGSPTLWRNVASFCIENKVNLPTLERVVMAGAPVPATTHEMLLHHILLPGAHTYTPYGATEAMPVAVMDGNEILAETAPITRQGGGTCVGLPVPGVTVEIIPITEGPVSKWDPQSILPAGAIGEIAVKADHVTKNYYKQPAATEKAKIPDGNGYWHRMGDAGYKDGKGRIWFCGRVAHRVETAKGTLFSVCCEAIFNCHPAVTRSALVGVPADGAFVPVIVIELKQEFAKADRAALQKELLVLGAANQLTSGITEVLFHPRFPTDIRHNAKIRREDLAVWAASVLPERK